MSKKILILYTSVGLGHKSIAENIGYHLEQAGYQVKLHDVLQLQAGPLVNIGTVIHQFIGRRLPFLWHWLYASADHGWFGKLTSSSRVKVASRNYQQTKKIVDEFQPDLVITTQTSASAIIQYLKQQNWYHGLFAIAFSDYHLHRFWLYEAADYYLVNIQEQKDEMIRLGLPADRIFVLGMTLLPRLGIDPTAVRQNLGLMPDDNVVLLTSGSLGTGLSTQWLEELEQALTQLPAKLVIVCGKNNQLRDLLQKKLQSAMVFGFYQPMAELYAISDIMLTKPGGLMVAEALQWHLPMLITYWLPGQEGINYDYLVQHKLLIQKPASVEPQKIVPLIAEELSHRQFRQSLISNPALVELVRLEREGQALIQAVNSMFHKV